MERKKGNAAAQAWGLVIGVILLVISAIASIRFGFQTISWGDMIAALTHYQEDSMEQVVVRTARLPRALMAIAVGASLAMAGALMQAVTRNPLASPSVLGINQGASFAIVLAITVFHWSDMRVLVWVSFGGALLAAAAAYMLGSMGKDGLSPLRVILGGSAIVALFSSFTQGLLVRNENGLQDVMFWLAGSIAARDIELLMMVAPYMLIGWVASLILAPQLNILIMGEEMARGLGQRVGLIRLLVGFIVVLLAGGSVAVAGPIGLIGIIVPHIARALAGHDHRWLLPYCAVYGAVLLLLADLSARFIIMPEEVPVGIMTAAVGAPFFIYIARKELRSK
ncbi:FecCD family ABC transporter permease [Paenibacillus sp. 1001270B_150601_E10]|uniref:FecCD family ABC transporter permease n=1 Tax=Paenibacillus sp. 1001270B_150601_E10 TaxID=2787079 RepID=UPI00189E0D4D|nr:iron ABC transporter permease [Paenibacillus sp. 1001270B_150601_E10]